MFVVLGIQNVMRMRRVYCHLWPVRLYNIVPRLLTNGNIFEKKSY